MTVDLDFGFDTRGLVQWANGGAPEDVINGFFLNMVGALPGQPKPIAHFEADYNAAAAIYLYIAEAEIGGGLLGDVNITLTDPNNDGRVHFDEFAADFANNPIDIFDASGKFTTGLHAYLKFEIDLPSPLPDISRTLRKDIATETLLEFGNYSGLNEPVLGTASGADVLVNIGPRALLRVNGNTADTVEIFEIKHVSGGVGNEAISFRYVAGQSSSGKNFISQRTVNDEIIADGGAEDDEIIVQSGVLSRAVLSGGAGADALEGGSGNDSISGDDGVDRLVGGPGNDTVLGGLDGDVLSGGPGGDLLDGGEGFDVVSFEKAGGPVGINLATGVHSGEAAGDTYISIEFFEGSEGFGDTFVGGGANDYLAGLGGNDTLDGGDGDDLLEGGVGGDQLIGGAGFDVASYLRSMAGVTVNLSTSAGSGGDAAGDTFSGIELIEGSTHDDTLTGDSAQTFRWSRRQRHDRSRRRE